ncbi:MAG: hypothetical protein WCH39_10860 [Schlesneria sp.]
MIRSQVFVLVVTVIGLAACIPCEVAGQQIYSGGAPAELQYPRSRGIDSNGRAVDVDGRVIDQVGSTVDDYGRRITNVGVPRQYTGYGQYQGNGYTSGGYGGSYPGIYNGVSYTDSVGLSGGYYSNGRPIGSAVVGANVISPPRNVIVGGVYPTRTVLNNATRGGVIEYTHNGNGYVYSPGSSYQTVISSGPNIFPAISVISPSEPPVVIETRRNVASAQPVSRAGEIKLMFPQGATSELSYMLNGTVYSIKPGYVQTFVEDRIWTIEFLRAGNRSQQMRYQLKAGTYLFTFDETGWDLRQAIAVAAEAQPSPGVPSSQVAPPTRVVTPTPPTPAPTPSPDL